MTKILKKIASDSDLKVVYCDLFDTIIHRNVHPNYVFRIWAKLMIREFGLPINTDELYGIRRNSSLFVSEKEKLKKTEVSYDLVIKETYRRLIASEILNGAPYDKFKGVFEEADYQAEILVQFTNKKIVSELEILRKQNYPLYIISDFHLPQRTINRILEYHDIKHLFDDVYISCSCGKSKEDGNIYPHILTTTQVSPLNTLMIGDNKRSDIKNAEKHALKTLYIKGLRHKIRNKINLVGREKKEYKKAFRKTELRCRKSKFEFSEYILHFYAFTERLYLKAKENNINNLFFLSREGMFLKQLFDFYQEKNQLLTRGVINTHYLKVSRQAAIQFAYKPIEEENFENFRKKYSEMSLRQFLNSFRFTDKTINGIIEDLNIDADKVLSNFVESDVMVQLRNNETFRESYEQNRATQKKAFQKYLQSFKVDIRKEGMFLVDVGWGGTMQECLYHFFDEQIMITGFYLGLREIYDITPETKRFGLNFTVYPNIGYTDHILMANTQLYEQFLAAPHGGVIAYGNNELSPAIEFHAENEKRVFEEHISHMQQFMYDEFKFLTQNLKPLNYSQLWIQNYLTDMALRLGLFTNRKQLKLLEELSSGFYQNIGQNKKGISYSANQIGFSRLQLIRQLLWSPEKTFRYLVKIKPMLNKTRWQWLGFTLKLMYYYIRTNRALKKTIFKTNLLN